MTELSYRHWTWKDDDGDTVMRILPGDCHKPVWVIVAEKGTHFIHAESSEYLEYEAHFQKNHEQYETPKVEQEFHPLFTKPEGWAQANSCCPHCGAAGGYVSLDEKTLKIDDDNFLKIKRSFSCALCHEMWDQHLKATVLEPTGNEVELL